ncbi:MAG TPA: sigma-70 family RNA polymerase sigma factor [Gemmataceae bacterium]
MPSSEGSSPSSVGELAALGKRFQEHRERLLGMLRRRMPPVLAARTDSDAILQDAYLHARRRWERFKRRSDRKPLPWLYRIALDCLIEAWRKETRAKRDARRDMPLSEDSAMAIGGPLIDTGTGPVHAAERDERRARVLAVMEQMRPEYREVLHMRHLDGLSHAEAAEVLGITPNAATVRYARACRKFQELWRRLNPDSEFGP